MIVNEVNNNLLYKVINNTHKNVVFEGAQKWQKWQKMPFFDPSGGGQKWPKNHEKIMIFYVQDNDV